MKRPIYLNLGVLVLMPLLFFHCKEEPSGLSMTLYDKPLPEIRARIKGNWKLHYMQGGVAGMSMKQYTQNTYYKFGENDKITITTNGVVYTEGTITWVKDLGGYTNGDSTYIMTFNDIHMGHYGDYVVNKIVNDTLVLHDAYVSDVLFYKFTKI